MALIKHEYKDKETVIPAKNLNDIQDAIIMLEDGLFSVDNDKKGDVITITDAAHRGFRRFNIFGKTTQDGIPTPDNPVELMNVGNIGNITVNVAGDNDSHGMTISTPNGLPGIPVTKGGNYTDANGQQWICDEIDLARGVYIQRINIANFNNAVGTREERSGSTYRFAFPLVSNPTFLPSSQQGSMCNALTINTGPVGQNGTNNAVSAYSAGGLYVRCDSYTTVSEFLAWAISVNLTVQYVLLTPIEKPIAAEELIAYASLHTYKDHTTVGNDAGAWMELEYVMDAKKYIASVSSAGASAGILDATVE